MVDFISLGGALSIPLILGLSLLNLFMDDRQHFYFWEKTFIALGLGWGVITLSMFYMSWAGIYFSPALITLFAFLPILVISIYRSYRITIPAQATSRILSFKQQAFKDWQCFEILLFWIMALTVIFLFFKTMVVVDDVWDSWAVWGFKAKIYFVHQIIPFEKFDKFRTAWGNWDYPHHVSLMETWIFLWLGYWNDQWSRVIFPLFHLGLVICLYAFFHRSLNHRIVSLAGAFFVLTLPKLLIMSTGAVCEPILLFYYVVSFRLLLEWQEIHDDRLLWLSAVFAGLATWTKNEGAAYVFFNLVIIYFMMRGKNFVPKITYALRYAGIAGLVIGPWWFLKSSLHLQNILVNSEHLNMGYLIENLSAINHAFARLTYFFARWGIFNITWIMFLIFLALNRNLIQKRPYNYLLLSIFFHISLGFVFSLLDPTEQYLNDLFLRLLVAPAILSLMYVVLIQKENLKESLR